MELLTKGVLPALSLGPDPLETPLPGMESYCSGSWSDYLAGLFDFKAYNLTSAPLRSWKGYPFRVRIHIFASFICRAAGEQGVERF